MSARPLRGFGRRREALGWSLGYAAMMLGISPGYLRQMERGSRPWPRLVALRMADLYQANLNDLATPAR